MSTALKMPGSFVAVSKKDVGLKIAVIKNSRIWQFFYQSPKASSHLNEIYLGRVLYKSPTFVWVDLGIGAPAALRPSPSTLSLHDGQKILVQVCRDKIKDNAENYEQKTKTLRVLTTIHLAGRYCIYHPHKTGLFFPEKLQEQLQEKIKSRTHFTLRLACSFLKNEVDLLKEMDELEAEWKQLNNSLLANDKPRLLKSNLKPLEKSLRDLLPDQEVIFDDVSILVEAKEFLQKTYPDLIPLLRQASLNELPLFESLDLAEIWDSFSSCYIPIDGGGNLYIEETACVTTIDVNSIDTRIDSLLNTATFIMSQIRLRQLSGNILIDFTRMPNDKKNKLKRYFEDVLITENPQKMKVMGWSSLGFLELQSPRYQDSLPMQLSEACKNCDGSGRVGKEGH